MTVSNSETAKWPCPPHGAARRLVGTRTLSLRYGVVARYLAQNTAKFPGQAAQVGRDPGEIVRGKKRAKEKGKVENGRGEARIRPWRRIAVNDRFRSRGSERYGDSG